jgi:hypothetical protein
MFFNYRGYESVVVTLCVYASLVATLLSGLHYIWYASRIVNA